MRRAVLLLAAAVVAGACGRSQPLTGDAGVDRSGAADAGEATDARNPASLGDGRCIQGAFPRDGGVCKCQPDIPTACATSCADVQTDDANCGACGHACGATSVCRDGACSVAPMTVVPAPSACQGVHLAAEGDVLYWTDTAARTVFALGEGDLRPTTLADQLVSPTIIAVANGTAVWFDEGKKALEVRLGPNLIGTPVVQSPPINGLAVSPDGATIYYSLGQSVLSVPVEGGTPTTLVTEKDGEPHALALEGTTLAFGDWIAEHVYAVTLVPGHVADCDSSDPVTGTPKRVDCQRVAYGQGSLSPDAIALRGSRAFWANGTTVNMNQLAPDAGSDYQSLAQSLTGDVTGLAATADAVYFTDGDAISKVAPAVGVPVIRLARGQKGARALAITTKHVYWTTDDCAIHAAPL